MEKIGIFRFFGIKHDLFSNSDIIARIHTLNQVLPYISSVAPYIYVCPPPNRVGAGDHEIHSGCLCIQSCICSLILTTSGWIGWSWYCHQSFIEYHWSTQIAKLLPHCLTDLGSCSSILIGWDSEGCFQPVCSELFHRFTSKFKYKLQLYLDKPQIWLYKHYCPPLKLCLEMGGLWNKCPPSIRLSIHPCTALSLQPCSIFDFILCICAFDILHLGKI